MVERAPVVIAPHQLLTPLYWSSEIGLDQWRFDQSQLGDQAELKAIAQIKGIPYQTLMRMLIVEGVSDSSF